MTTRSIPEKLRGMYRSTKPIEYSRGGGMTVVLERKDFNTLVRYLLREEAVLKDSYGIPGRKAETWEEEYRRDNPEDFKLFDQARKAIARGCSSGRR